MIRRIFTGDPDDIMPPSDSNKSLTIEQKESLRRWIAEGAVYEGHWAFEPVRQPDVPGNFAPRSSTDRNPVDAFIRKELVKANLKPSAQADARTLIRRATYDLHGLPPHAREVEQFEDKFDLSPRAAFAELVDRLLASPRYGERWGRRWLDLARYSDTRGFIYTDRMEKRFAHAHVYRDWVIGALNEDMPYDRFLKLQIAADQMDCEKSDLAAMGFLTVGRWLLGVMPDIVDDRLDTLMRTTQAMTISCARCHDHKYDPIPTKDYYSLYGVFSGSAEKLVPLEPIENGSPEFQDGLRERQRKFEEALKTAKDELASRIRRTLAEYLAVQPTVQEQPGDEVYVDLHGDDLVPAVARRWERYLAEQRSNPVWTAWFAFAALPQSEFAAQAAPVWTGLKSASTDQVNPVIAMALGEEPPASLQEVASRYAMAFSGIPEQPADDEPPHIASLREVLYGEGSPCLAPDAPLGELSFYLPESDRIALGLLEAEIERWIVEAPGATPHALLLVDREEHRDAVVFVRGNPSRRGGTVPRRYLECIEGNDRKPFTKGSGRMELAELIASGNNPLTARVAVNRVWQGLFGEGIVRTPSDFGTRGEPPTHPELLDWLAVQFVERAWSLKELHRLIMSSEAYQRSSVPTAGAQLSDPENRLLSHQNRRRLDFESLRDSLLQVSDELDLRMGGNPDPMFGNAFSPRRTVYGYVDRQYLPAELTVFDGPSADIHTAQRHETTVAQQSLFLLNGQFSAARARALVAKLDESHVRQEDRVRALYQTLFQRNPSQKELDLGLRFTGRGSGPGVMPEVNSGVTARNGAWLREGDELVQISTDTDVGLFFGDPAWTDYTLEVEARLDAGQDGPQLAVRANGAREMYWVYYGSYGGQRHGAERETGGRLEPVGEPGPAGFLEKERWFQLRVEVRGEEVKCYLDGEKVYEFKDNRHAHGRIGIGSWGATIRYRNLTVKDKEKQLLFAGLPEPPGGPLTTWERYAQVLLLSNEFNHVD